MVPPGADQRARRPTTSTGCIPMNEATANISRPLFFNPPDWVQLTPAFGQLKSVVAPHGPKLIANSHTATYFNWCVHEGHLELALVAPDLTYRLFDDAERRKLTIRVPLDYKEGCGIEPYQGEGLWYVRRSGLEKRTNDPGNVAGSAAAEAPKLSGKQWVRVAYARRPDELLAMGITGASEALAKESESAADCAKPLTARYIEKLLRELKVFPKAHRGSKQPPK